MAELIVNAKEPWHLATSSSVSSNITLPPSNPLYNFSHTFAFAQQGLETNPVTPIGFGLKLYYLTYLHGNLALVQTLLA